MTFTAAANRCRYIIPTTMDTLDPAGEFLRISERYRQMSDGELLVLILQSSELTPYAQQALANEVRQRGLKAEVKVEAEGNALSASSQFKPPRSLFGHQSAKCRDSASHDFPDADSKDDPNSSDDADAPYEEDRKLVDLCTVWSERDALQLQRLLDVAAIPFFMGPEQATGVDAVTSNFTKGVDVRIMQIGMPWVRSAMLHYEPEDDPNPKPDEELDEILMLCPKCHSTEVVFEGRTPAPAIATDESSQKFKWTCDSCGYQWEDDGIVKEE